MTRFRFKWRGKYYIKGLFDGVAVPIRITLTWLFRNLYNLWNLYLSYLFITYGTQLFTTSYLCRTNQFLSLYYSFQYLFCYPFKQLIRQVTQCSSLPFLPSICYVNVIFTKQFFLLCIPEMSIEYLWSKYKWLFAGRVLNYLHRNLMWWRLVNEHL